jgi:hypothetical protein
MAWRYEIDRNRGLVITAAWDSVDGAQVLEHQFQLQTDADFNPDFYQFIDFLRVTKMEMDLQTVVKLSDMNLFSQKSHRAFFAGSKSTSLRNVPHVHRVSRSGWRGPDTGIQFRRGTPVSAEPHRADTRFAFGEKSRLHSQPGSEIQPGPRGLQLWRRTSKKGSFELL